MRATVEDQAPGFPHFTANNAPGYPDHIGYCEIFFAILTEGSKLSRYPKLKYQIVLSAPGVAQPEMRSTNVEEQVPGVPLTNAPGYPDHIGTERYFSLS
jgi:hypothetical protein